MTDYRRRAPGPSAEAEASRLRETIEDGEALAAAFEAAGQRIEAALAGAAHSGEADFRRMAEAILRDLARIAAEAILLQHRPHPTLTLQANFSPATDEMIRHDAADLSATLARLVQAGGRYL